MLLAVYKTPAIPVEKIAEEHFSMNGANAARAAALHRLPFPTFRLRDSQKAPLLVYVTDLAKHIDSQREDAVQKFERSQL